MLLYWRRFDRVEKEHRKKAEKEAMEQRRQDEEMREAILCFEYILNQLCKRYCLLIKLFKCFMNTIFIKNEIGI